MPKTLQFRRGNTSTIGGIIPAQGELLVNTDNNTIAVGDGTTTGGWPTPTLAYVQAAFAAANVATGSELSYIQGIENTQNTNITNATTLSQSAFNKANTGGSGGVSSIIAGSNISISPTNGLGNVTITSTASGLSSAFTTVDVGNTAVFYASGSDTLNFVAGNNMSISTSTISGVKSLIFASSGGGGGGGGGGGTFGATAVFAPGGGNASSAFLTGLTIPSGYTSSAGFILLALDFSGGSVISAYDSTANHAFTQHYWSGGGSTAFQLTGYGSGGDSFYLQTTGQSDQVGYGPGFVVTSTDLASPGSYTTTYSWSNGSIAPGNPGLNTTQNYAYGYLQLFSSYGSISSGLTAGTGVSMYLDSAHNGVWFKVPGTTWASGGPWATYPGNPGSSFYMTTMFFGQ